MTSCRRGSHHSEVPVKPRCPNASASIKVPAALPCSAFPSQPSRWVPPGLRAVACRIISSSDAPRLPCHAARQAAPKVATLLAQAEHPRMTGHAAEGSAVVIMDLATQRSRPPRGPSGRRTAPLPVLVRLAGTKKDRLVEPELHRHTLRDDLVQGVSRCTAHRQPCQDVTEVAVH